MQYSLIKCTFSTPIHIGTSTMGNALQKTDYSVCADTLYSAICHEAVKRDSLLELTEAVEEGKVCISDMLPFKNDILYVPKPIFYKQREDTNDEKSSAKKKLKRLQFIPANMIDQFMNGDVGKLLDSGMIDNTFGKASVRQCVSITMSTPYQIGIYQFAPNCGLYIVVGWEMEKQYATIKRLVTNLGYCGIGGKRNAGLGKFTCEFLALPEYYLEMLENKTAETQMLISCMLPQDDDLEKVLDGAWYQLIRRGGFVTSQTYLRKQVKKKTCYLFKAGSCFMYREQGHIMDAGKGGNHPVWKYAKGMYVGVDI